MHQQYSALIIENGKPRYAMCSGYTPGEALNYLVQIAHIRKGATVYLGEAWWEGFDYVSCTTVFSHIPEFDTELCSKWDVNGTGLTQYITAKPE